jgi:hypothetical protein
MATYRITAPDGGTYEVTAPDTATEAEVLAYAQKNYKGPEPTQVTAPTKPKTFLESAGEAVRDTAAGAVRGAGSIGATILAPVDYAARKAGIQNDFIGRTDRREQMTEGLRSLGADTDSTAFKVGKLGGEIAGTAGAGGVMANGVRALSGARAMSGLEPILSGVARGLETGGFRVGELAGTGMGTAARLGTGAAVGGAAAGMLNPQDAGLGALIGGAMPGAVQLSGKAGGMAGSMLRGGKAGPTPEIMNTAQRSMDAGYIIPPSMVNPSFRNRTLESLSGKFETAQMAATKNQGVTDSLVRKALGLADDAPLNQETMQTVRQQAGQVYQQLKGTGTVTADKQFVTALDDIAKTVKSATASFPQLGKTNMHGQPVDEIGQLVSALKQPQFDAGGAVDAIAVLRDNADVAYRAGDNALGKANKAAAKALEDMLDRHLQQIGATDMLPAYRNARQLIAKTYTVEKGLREGAGTVDARALARELQKKKPLTGDLRTVAEFGNTFNKAAQPPHLIGSPGVNVLKPALSMLTGAAGGAAMGPAGVALGAGNYVLPPVARSLMFSKPFQRGLLNMPTGMLDEAAPMGLLTQGAYRGAPLLSAQ